MIPLLKEMMRQQPLLVAMLMKNRQIAAAEQVVKDPVAASVVNI